MSRKRMENIAIENRARIWEEKGEKYKRNVEIVRCYLRGDKVIDIAARFNIARQRVYQILDGFKDL